MRTCLAVPTHRRLCSCISGPRRFGHPTSDHRPSKVGIPAGYRWGYILTADGDDATVVTEVLDYGPLSDEILRDGGAWINGANSVLESMTASLESLEKISTGAHGIRQGCENHREAVEWHALTV